jgi:23S rRNA pseudouridine1911/1915/1917 synthase
MGCLHADGSGSGAADDRVSPLCVPEQAAGERLDRFLAGLGSLGTRSQVQRLIAAGSVMLNGRQAKAGATLRAGDTVEVTSPEAPPAAQPEPEDIPLHVLYEDEDLLVIDKPAGMVVHPAPGHWQGTLVSALLHRWRGAPPGLDRLRPGIVHRLDRETSGVLVIGKTADVVARLAAQFKARDVEKEYLALVWRCPAARRGVIDRPIGRHPTQRKRMSVRTGGRTAVTRYEVCEDFGDASLLRLFPETGRTHQLRVHLAASGHPVLGDKLYGRRRPAGDALLGAFPRQALHAARLVFTQPRTGARLRCEAPLPSDLSELLHHLRSRRQTRSAAAGKRG